MTESGDRPIDVADPLDTETIAVLTEGAPRGEEGEEEEEDTTVGGGGEGEVGRKISYWQRKDSRVDGRTTPEWAREESCEGEAGKERERKLTSDVGCAPLGRRIVVYEEERKGGTKVDVRSQCSAADIGGKGLLMVPSAVEHVTAAAVVNKSKETSTGKIFALGNISAPCGKISQCKEVGRGLPIWAEERENEEEVKGIVEEGGKDVVRSTTMVHWEGKRERREGRLEHGGGSPASEPINKLRERKR